MSAPAASATRLAHELLQPSDLLLLTPRQRRLLRPLCRQAPLVRLLLAGFALAIDPLCRLEAAIGGYHHSLFAVLDPAPSRLLAAGRKGDRHVAD